MLRTWALLANPVADDFHEVEIIAEQLPDHRLAYLDYEGPVSHERGRVARVDAGQFEVLSETEFELALELAGEKLSGLWKLSRSSATASNHWVLRRIRISRAT